MASLLLLIGLAFTVVGMIYFIGFASRTFVFPFDWFGVAQYFLIGIGLFLMALARVSEQKPGEGFWNMKHGKTD
jgi:hypothetical protein